MIKRGLWIAAAVSLAGCGLDGANDFRRGVPTADAVKLQFPEKAGLALEGEGVQRRQDELQGQRADMYKLTRLVTVTVNGGTAAVLGLVKGITDYPPTSVQGNVAVWGPHTDALSPNTYQFTVTKGQGNEYTYVLEGKGKNDPNTAFRKLLVGKHTQAVDANGKVLENFGEGSFLIDWNEAQKLPEHGKEVGTADISYSHLSAAAQVKVDAVFKQVKDEDTGKLYDANYKYAQTPNVGGTFDFDVEKDLVVTGSGKLEKAATRSRWEANGAGRSDVKAAGGDLVGPATLSECWNSNFNSSFLEMSWNANAGYGDQTKDCASFKTPDFPTVTP